MLSHCHQHHVLLHHHSTTSGGKHASTRGAKKLGKKSGLGKTRKKSGKSISKGATVQPRKGPQAKRKKGSVKRRSGHVKQRMAGRKTRAIRKLLFAQASLIQAEQNCAQARQRRRRALLKLAWKLTRRILRPMLLGPQRLGMKYCPQPVTREKPPAMMWIPRFVLRSSRPIRAWKSEEETVAVQVGATCAGSSFLSRVLTPNHH